jgi:signal peptidase I
MVIFPYDDTQMPLEKEHVPDPTDLRKPIVANAQHSEAVGSATNKKPEEKKPTVLQVIWETVRYAAFAAIIIIPIRTFIAQPFVVSGNSMFPTFHNGEYLIVDETTKYIGEYYRGDVVILRYPNDPSKYFIKRVIGLPGETVTVQNGIVSITSAERVIPLVLSEPYVKNAKFDNSVRTLSDSEYFVMGDNRAQSSDSRVWGPVPKALMDGKALIRLLPISAATLHPGGVSGFGVSY